MKKFFVLPVLLLVLACSNEPKKKDDASNKPTVITRYEKSLVIAFYHQDSLKERFDYYKREDQAVTRKQKAFESELKRRSKELEDYIRRNDEKARSGLLSQNQAAKIEEESVKKLEAITKKIETLGKMYCEKNGIDILLIQGVGGQLNFINEKMNVTSDFIRFLNENQASIEKDLK